MDVLVTLNSGRSGRDKVFRLSQYVLKLIGGLRGGAENLKKVEKNIASFRYRFSRKSDVADDATSFFISISSSGRCSDSAPSSTPCTASSAPYTTGTPT